MSAPEICSKCLGLHPKTMEIHRGKSILKKCVRLGEEFKNCVKDFYNRDDVSRVTTGKWQTVTRNKVKMQKRFLMDTLRNLHRKFLADNLRKSISYSLFCRLRLYWVVHPTLSDRHTCLCKLHENLGFVVQKLWTFSVDGGDLLWPTQQSMHAQ